MAAVWDSVWKVGVGVRRSVSSLSRAVFVSQRRQAKQRRNTFAEYASISIVWTWSLISVFFPSKSSLPYSGT